ncbi:MAG: type I DNA topoisomerase [Firmicutes bacterium]|nr:type I DNA topoisomerase [Bacillota bacterium]
MSKKLVIVESPSKSKTIEQYLGKEYKVLSSKGHIRDLAISGPGGLGIDVTNHFKPTYEVLPEKKALIKELNQALKTSTEVFLATDPDREGEAISWHLLETLNVGHKPVKRVIFNEITKDAITEAFENPKDIDLALVESQETRRILDRIIGFKLSKLLQNKIKSKSAGRVQSAALKLLTDREKEINAFIEEEYYDISVSFAGFTAKLFKYMGHTPKLPDLKLTDEILSSLQEEYLIASVEKKEKSTFSRLPFITSTLQQEASTKYGLSSTKTMQVAQKLYEGIQIGDESVGLITYMRTDSTRLSQTFMQHATEYVLHTYGKEYLGHARKNIYKGKIQDAHEAIRPTSCSRTPESIKRYLSKDEFRIYSMIYSRAIAFFMKPSINEITTVLIENNLSLFKVSASKPVFDGYLKLYGSFEVKEEEEEDEKTSLPPLKENQILMAETVNKKQMFTMPPSRYSEAKLIKEMEDLGIGRPSTYAQTIQLLKTRKYVAYTEKKFHPTEQGIMTIHKLDEFFNEFISSNYSKDMENVLDEVAAGSLQGETILQEFYDYFIPLYEHATKHMEKEQPKQTGEVCPKCGSTMVHRHGKFGDFEACSNFPKCKYIKPSENAPAKPVDTGVLCPVCQKGTLIERIAKKGKNAGSKFYGCSNYPSCKHISPLKPTGRKCPVCGKDLVLNEQNDVQCLDSLHCDYKETNESA